MVLQRHIVFTQISLQECVMRGSGFGQNRLNMLAVQAIDVLQEDTLDLAYRNRFSANAGIGNQFDFLRLRAFQKLFQSHSRCSNRCCWPSTTTAAA